VTRRCGLNVANTFLLGIAGPHLLVSGAVFAGGFISQRPTDFGRMRRRRGRLLTRPYARYSVSSKCASRIY